jgi:hypothetical protein
MDGVGKVHMSAAQRARGAVCFRCLSFIDRKSFNNTSRLPEEPARAALRSVLTSGATPRMIVRRLTTLLIDAVVNADEDADVASYRALLSAIQQRYPAVLQGVAEHVVSARADAKDAVEQLVISLSVVSSVSFLSVRMDGC